MNTTDTQAPAVPRGWPPEQPVEIVSISRRLVILGVAVMVANALAICWLAHEQRQARLEASERGARLVNTIEKSFTPGEDR